MKRNFLPDYVGISLTKSQFCFCTGLTPYRLRQILKESPERWQKLGLSHYDKYLMPSVVSELLAQTGLHIDLDLYAQYVAGQRGIDSLQIGVRV